MKVKKLVALIAAVVMTTGLVAGCGKSSMDTSDNTGTSGSANSSSVTEAADNSTAADTDLTGTKISFLNSKGEIQTA